MAFNLNPHPQPNHRRRGLSDPLTRLTPPRSLSGAVAPLLPGSRMTGRPHLDTPAIGRPKLARPIYYLVKLRDGRPGVVAAADHTKVWTMPRLVPRPSRLLHSISASGPIDLPADDRPRIIAEADHTRVRLPHYDAHPYQVVAYGPSWWDQLRNVLRPQAGFALYSEDHDGKSLEDPARYVRRGYVYDGIDVTQLKKSMDMTTEAWEQAEGAEKLLNWLLRLSKNSVASITKAQDAAEAAKAVKESLLVDPEVKAVVYAPIRYSGHKTSLGQVDSLRQLPFPKGATAGGAGYRRIPNGAGYDSAWVASYYKGDSLIGRMVAPPRR